MSWVALLFALAAVVTVVAFVVLASLDEPQLRRYGTG